VCNLWPFHLFWVEPPSSQPKYSCFSNYYVKVFNWHQTACHTFQAASRWRRWNGNLSCLFVLRCYTSSWADRSLEKETDCVRGKTNLQVCEWEILGNKLPDGELNIVKGRVLPACVGKHTTVISKFRSQQTGGPHTHTYTFCRCRITCRFRSSLFWDIMQRRVTISDVSGQSTGTIFKGKA
jgi:hypothetical protein